MDLNFNNKLEEYYQKFIELQEKLKKSEEQRFVLEMKFTEMVQVSKEEEQAHYKKLRSQYKRFLEEDQKRQDRNERIIRNLERIEAKISMLSAKTERISIFRRQYHKYLQRIVNSNPEKKVTDSKISRERSFIKEEPLKGQQPRSFRDDYSLPERPKDTLDKEKTIYEHPAVKKSLEKDRSNEEKIEILDRYLQSISSQKCRDVLNQERQAQEKLSFDTPIDKLLKHDLTSNSTNHATAVADDIMNSIYSRYYTKAEVTPKNNKADLQKEMQNGSKEIYYTEKSDYAEKDFKPDDKNYLDSLFSKNTDATAEKSKPTVSFKEQILLVKDGAKNNKESREKTPESDYSNGFKNKPVGSHYFEDLNTNSNLPTDIKLKQDVLKIAPENDFRNHIGDYNNSKNEYKIETDLRIDEKANTNFGTTYIDNKNIDEMAINEVKESGNSLTSKNKLDTVDRIINDPPDKYFKENKNNVSYDPSGIVEKSILQTAASNKDQNLPIIVKEDQQQNEEQLKQQSQEQTLKYDINNHIKPSQAQLQDQNQLHQSQEQPLEYDPVYQNNPTESYLPKGQDQASNQLNEYLQANIQNKTSPSVDLGITGQNNQNDQLVYNDQDGSSIQYAEKDESREPMEYDPNNQPPQLYEQNPPTDNAQPIQFNPPDQSLMQYDENSVQPVQIDETGQALQFTENDPASQQIQYNEDGQPIIQYNNNSQPIPYEENSQPIQYEENSQPIQYDENGQPIGYDQYGQPLMYDQNGQIIQPQYDENGQFIPQYDENGQMIMLYDHNGQQLFDDQYKGNQHQYDMNSQPVVQYDENGQPIYDQNQQQYYDYTNQEQVEPFNEYNQYQSSEQGHYVEPQENQLNDHIEDSDQPQTGESNYYQVDDQGPYPTAEKRQIEEGDQYQTNSEHDKGQENTTGEVPDVINEAEETKEVIEENIEKHNEMAKPTNVMDILDTDTESAKQNTSKISNESDFDFN